MRVLFPWLIIALLKLSKMPLAISLGITETQIGRNACTKALTTTMMRHIPVLVRVLLGQLLEQLIDALLAEHARFALHVVRKGLVDH